MVKQPATDPARMTAGGIYNYAVSYHRSADQLAEAKLRVTHPEMPVRWLYYHSLELYLKAFLLLHGFTPAKLQKIGHDIQVLRIESERRGFKLGSEDGWVLSRMATGDTIIRSRYIETGTHYWPTVDALTRAAELIRKTARANLRAAGEPIR